jgi:VWFA-related protein
MRPQTYAHAFLAGNCFLLSVWMLSQEAPKPIVLDVPIVNVDFTVRDSTGKLITDLNRYDFEVRDNGESRDIQNFSPVKTPYNVLLLLDCSESTRDRLNLLVAAMARFADQLRPQDKAAIAVFGTDVGVID